MFPDGPTMPHFGKLNDLEAVAEDGLTQAARLHVDVILGGGHEHLPAIVLKGHNNPINMIVLSINQDFFSFYVKDMPSGLIHVVGLGRPG